MQMKGKGQSPVSPAVGERQSYQSQEADLGIGTWKLTESMRLELRNDSNKIADCLDFG